MTPDHSAPLRPTSAEIAALAETMDRVAPEPISVGVGPNRIEISTGGVASRYVEFWDPDLVFDHPASMRTRTHPGSSFQNFSKTRAR